MRLQATNADAAKGYASRVLSVFKPLDVAPRTVLLAVGSHVDVQWDGRTGPLPWPVRGFASDTPLRNNQNGIEVATREGAMMHAHAAEVTSLTSNAAPLLPSADWSADVQATIVSDYTTDSYAHMLNNAHDSTFISIQRTAPNSTAGGLNAPGLQAFRISCLELTPYTPREALGVDIRVGNVPSSSLTQPVVAGARIHVECLPRISIRGDAMQLGVGSTQHVELHAAAGLGASAEQLDSAALLRTHPLLQNISFWSEDPDIASVGPTGLVTGVALGRTLLHVQLNHPAVIEAGLDADGLHAVVPVSVQFDSFFVVLPSFSLLQHRHLTAHIEGVNGETPLQSSFDFVETTWSTDSSCIELLPPFTDAGHHDVATAYQGDDGRQSVSVYGPSVRVVARRTGRATLNAVVRIVSPSAYGREVEATETRVSGEVTVIEPLTLDSPSILLLPPGATTVIRTSLDDSPGFKTTYEVMSTCAADEGIISVDEHGKITANADGHEGDAMVLVTSEWVGSGSQSSKRPMMQTVAVEVSVRQVAQLSLRPSRSLSGPLCVGSNITAEVVLHDWLGRTFDSIEGYSLGALSVTSSEPTVIRAQQKSALRASAGRAAAKDGGEEVRAGVVALVSFNALSVRKGPLEGIARGEHRSTSSAVVRLALESQADIRPYYVRLHAAADVDACTEPPSAEVVMKMQAGTLPVAHTSVRKRWAARLQADLAAALSIPERRIALARVEATSGLVHFHILPGFRAFAVHPHQWQLAPDEDEDRSVPLLLAEELQKQLGDSYSILRTGSVTSYVDPSTPLVIGGALAFKRKGVASEGTSANLDWLDSPTLTEDVANDSAAVPQTGQRAHKEEESEDMLSTLVLTTVAVCAGLVYLYRLVCFRASPPRSELVGYGAFPGQGSGPGRCVSA